MEIQGQREDGEVSVIQKRNQQTATNEHAETSKDEDEEEMEIHETKNQKRRRRDGGVKKQTAKENRDRDESPLNWAGTGTEEKILQHRQRESEDNAHDKPQTNKKTKNRQTRNNAFNASEE